MSDHRESRGLASRALDPLRRQVRDASLNMLIASPLVPRGMRWRLLSWCGLDVERSTINAKAFIGGTNVGIGEGSFINYEAFIDNAARVSIGERVSFGPRVMILTGTHEIGERSRRAGTPHSRPVVIEDGAWIGAQAVILPGVTVGAGSVVAAGSVVTHDVSPNTMVAGVPAMPKRGLES